MFWEMLAVNEEEGSKEISIAIKGCVVILSSEKRNIVFLLEDDAYFMENSKIMDARIVRTYSETGVALLHSKLDDEIVIDDKTYLVKEIVEKKEYFARKAFAYVEKDNKANCYVSNGNIEESLEEIKDIIVKDNSVINKRIDIYQKEKCIPLSSFYGSNMSFENYIKIINTLLFDKKYALLAGERIDVDLSKGFVMDVTSMIVLFITNKLDCIPKEYISKICITVSAWNKFTYYFNTLCSKQEEVEKFLYVDDNKNLQLREYSNVERLKRWRAFKDYIDNFEIVNIEAEKDELYNSRTEEILDKVQFDLIMLSKKRNIPFISDDLMLRKISNNYGIIHTNSMQICKYFSKKIEDYINDIVFFAGNNYVYSLYNDDFVLVIKYLLENYNDESRDLFLLLINSLLENKACLEYYVPFLRFKIENMEKQQYTSFGGIVIENQKVKFIIENILRIINNQCDKFGVDPKSIK